jgi:hypothetical protein
LITREDLETFSSEQLHRRALDLAKTERDIDWLWHVLGSIPAAEGQIGELDNSDLDIASLVTAINRYILADRSAEDALRPQYVEYLLEHL